MNPCDIAIIGGGPCGSLAAISAFSHNKGSNVTIFEKRKKSGYPPHCSGLIGIEGLKKLGIHHSAIKKTSFNKIKQAKFISPTGKSILINRNKSELLVLDRPKLDAYLANKAQKLGANFLYQSTVKEIQRRSKIWKIFFTTERKNCSPITATIAISAEGHHPKISAQTGLPTPSNNWFLPGIQYELDNVGVPEKDTVELFFGNNVAPGFFAWMIPLNEVQARVGLAIHPNLSKGARYYLNYMIKKHPVLSPKLTKSKILNSWGGFVPASGPINKTFTDGFLVVGDAAGQTKATTGGGFNVGGLCSQFAGQIACQSVLNNDASSKYLRKYEMKWKSYFEPELSLMKTFRRLLSYLPDKTLDGLFDIAIQTELAHRMRRVENIDLHGMGLLKYSVSPPVLIRAFKHTPHLINSLFQGLLA
ncbi:MAG: geranylgeranyl reductase family protein [Candidatus Kariarchaeaceae archaeon]|jgi:geranylgeranyl reductase family protein